jgi:protease-4
MKTKALAFAIVLIAVALCCASCFRLKVQLGGPSGEALKEYTIEGKGKEKVLVIPLTGFISDKPGGRLAGSKPSTVEEVASRLRLARESGDVKAVVFEVNSPGGSMTASDMIYKEIVDFKEKTGAKVVALFMDVAASGGYYVSLAADRIVAHPTTITGSIGVILITPQVSGLMDKLGITVDVSKSGSEKDIGSPFRPATPAERKIFQDITDEMGRKFIDLVGRNRKIGPENLQKIATARIYTADEALRLGLVDSIGYVQDGVKEARKLAGLPEDARVVVYRREKYPNDTLYNTAAGAAGSSLFPPLVDINLPDILPPLEPGLYYLWLPGGSRG